MQVKRDGVVFRTAYGFTRERDCPTDNINGCELLWRFVSRAPVRVLWIILHTIFLQPLFSLVLLIFSVGAMFFGYRMHWIREPEKRQGFRLWVPNWLRPIYALTNFSNWSFPEPIQNWPTVFGFRGWPFMTALIGLEIWLLSAAYQAMYSADFYETAWPLVFLWNGIMALALVIVAFVLIYDISEDSEVVKLMKARIQSFKDKTCPVVEVVD